MAVFNKNGANNGICKVTYPQDFAISNSNVQPNEATEIPNDTMNDELEAFLYWVSLCFNVWSNSNCQSFKGFEFIEAVAVLQALKQVKPKIIYTFGPKLVRISQENLKNFEIFEKKNLE